MSVANVRTCTNAFPDGLTWRDALLRYNEASSNPLNLARAFELYKNEIYRRLVTRFGMEKVFILSAGWGLINAAFLTPYYDITFSHSVTQKGEPYKLRKKGILWHDLCQLPSESDEPIIFFGGKDYVPLFCTLTRSNRGQRTIFHKSKVPPAALGCALERYRTNTRNWHYECANAFLDGKLGDVDTNFLKSDRPASGGELMKATPLRSASDRMRENAATRPAQSRSASAPPKAEDFRSALWNSFMDAESKGERQIDIVAGDLHKQVGGYPGANHRMSVCCEVMHATMKPGDTILNAPPSGKGASLVIRYALPRENC